MRRIARSFPGGFILGVIVGIICSFVWNSNNVLDSVGVASPRGALSQAQGTGEAPSISNERSSLRRGSPLRSEGSFADLLSLGALDRSFHSAAAATIDGLISGTEIALRAVQIEGEIKQLYEQKSVSDGLMQTLTSEVTAYFDALASLNVTLAEQLILDVGANIGSFSLAVAQKCPRCTIVALEPNPRTFVALQLNVGHLANVVALNLGIAGMSGIRSFVDVPTHTQGSTLVAGILPGNNVHVRVLSMRDLLAMLPLPLNRDFDIIKIDCEGCEYEVYADDFWRKPRDAVLGETHERWGYSISAATRAQEEDIRKIPWVRLN